MRPLSHAHGSTLICHFSRQERCDVLDVLNKIAQVWPATATVRIAGMKYARVAKCDGTASRSDAR